MRGLQILTCVLVPIFAGDHYGTAPVDVIEAQLTAVFFFILADALVNT